MVAGKIGYDDIYRIGHMRNGMFADNSAGKSKHANFLSGGLKASTTWTIGGGNVLSIGLGMNIAHQTQAMPSLHQK